MESRAAFWWQQHTSATNPRNKQPVCNVCQMYISKWNLLHIYLQNYCLRTSPLSSENKRTGNSFQRIRSNPYVAGLQINAERSSAIDCSLSKKPYPIKKTYRSLNKWSNKSTKNQKFPYSVSNWLVELFHKSSRLWFCFALVLSYICQNNRSDNKCNFL